MTSPTKTSTSGSMTSKEYARRVAVPHSLGFKPTSGSPTRDKLRQFSSSASERVGAIGAELIRKVSGIKSEKKHPVELLNLDSTADDGPPHPVIVSSTMLSNTSSTDRGKQRHVAPIGTRSDSASPVRTIFTTDAGPHFVGGHYVKVSFITSDDHAQLLKALFNEVSTPCHPSAIPSANIKQFDWEMKILGQKLTPPSKSGFHDLLVCFDDIAEAATAEEEANMVTSRWVVAYVQHAEYAAAHSILVSPVDDTFHFDGQVVFAAAFRGNLANINISDVKETVREIAKSFGKLLAFDGCETSSTFTMEFRAEYNCISSARKALADLNDSVPLVIEGWYLTAKMYSTLPMSPTSSADAGQSAQVSTPTDAGTPAPFVSSTGRSTWYYDANGVCHPALAHDSRSHANPRSSGIVAYASYNHIGAPLSSTGQPRQDLVQQPYHHEPATRNHRGDNYGQGLSHYAYDIYETQLLADKDCQKVTLEGIFRGDMRTTIMLRNIPKEWTCDDLKIRLDEYAFGRYDFSYLRMEFGEGVNMAYGFVNFISADDLYNYVQDFVGKLWAPNANDTKKQKESAVAYATVQGIDCLIEKFRNSSVMDECPTYRPKLWFIAADAPNPSMVGQEKPFPGPNNYQRKQRSINDAQHSGLFPANSGPRGGPRTSDGQRRSTYDRGTLSQIRQDAQLNISSGKGFYTHTAAVHSDAMHKDGYVHPTVFNSRLHGHMAMPRYIPAPFHVGMAGIPQQQNPPGIPQQQLSRPPPSAGLPPPSAGLSHRSSADHSNNSPRYPSPAQARGGHRDGGVNPRSATRGAFEANLARNPAIARGDGTLNSPCTITRNAQHGLAGIGEEPTLPSASYNAQAQSTEHGHGNNYTLPSSTYVPPTRGALPSTRYTSPAQAPQHYNYMLPRTTYAPPAADSRRIAFAPEVDSHPRHNGNTARTSSYTNPPRSAGLPPQNNSGDGAVFDNDTAAEPRLYVDEYGYVDDKGPDNSHMTAIERGVRAFRLGARTGKYGGNGLIPGANPKLPAGSVFNAAVEMAEDDPIPAHFAQGGQSSQLAATTHQHPK
ncbi:uncharacterized protein MYCGRDRAFT_94937 [Zymoseptoria tritici IPO323]|uniref:Mei2-like C-terminal RNA recognition motif domain-containing protein n=1 Tax=Zymoseptoria tritici (strain CBS 115943 / IPO323) TaxID=336722 RepID=F9XI57_ZYMTI|nr:uncharacterized protein MYCGRDRAFT_94937 [Zymoseptoria tritici IPO323]EGP84883.1 hypothetical protein MYCGRDRAFT_94937 [Zymoseptoria tritici IPO323]